MRKTFRFLVITDHRVHKPSNPVYVLIPALLSHPQCEQVAIVSRGNHNNDSFFQGEKTQFFAHKVNPDFQFCEDGKQFVEDVFATSLAEFDAAIMRLARPVTNEFLKFLNSQGEDLIFINDPLGIEKTSNKAFLLNFPEVCPPLKLCYTVDEILDFSTRFPIVLKPLKEYGGKGIIRIENGKIYGEEVEYEAEEYLINLKTHIEKNGYLAMKFLKNVSQGDKRVLVVGGEIFGASLRMPKDDSWVCNVAQGGYAVPAEADSDEKKIVEQITPVLASEGIFIYGMDTLVNDDGKRILSEINTLSVGGWADIEAQSDRPLIKQTIDKIVKYVEDQPGGNNS